MSVLREDWQLKYAVVKDRSGYILQSGTWADCIFLVGRGTPRVYLNGHKLILAMASPVFEAMLYGEIAEKDAIHIPDVDPEPFQAMLDYIYTDKINVESFDKATALYYCGNKYMLPYLTDGCVKYLLENLNSTNVCQTYEFAKMFDEYELMDQCLQLIQLRTAEVLNDDSFLEAKINTVQDIFCLTPLNLENELELFKAAVRYAKANGSKDNESSVHGSLVDLQEDFERNEETDQQGTKLAIGNTAEIKLQNAKDTNTISGTWDKEKSIFRNLLDKILLLTLTPQQFAEDVARSPYLTQEEAFALLMNIASSNTDVAIPKGFNESRKQRYRLVAEPAYNQDLGIETNKTRSQTKFRFTIPDFKKSKTMSMPFVVRKLSWRIAINPKPEKGLDQECLGIFLYCDYIDKNAIWSCSAIAELNIISNKSNVVHLLKKVEHTFTSNDKNRGSVVSMEIILDPKKGYVKNDAIKIEVNLVAQEPVGI